MLSYQHGYHAGNYADVVKHITLLRLIQYMCAKEKPIFYLETHSGRGIYDLQDKQALKTGEARLGVELVWAERKKLPPVFSSYIEELTNLNDQKTLRYYPGSPALAIHRLRKQDTLFFSELHPGEFQYLQTLPHPGKRVFYNNDNGLDKLAALLPPPERRGLIFLDPSYEIKTEYRDIPKLLNLAYRRFATGVYCIWYPIVDKKLHAQLLRGLSHIGAKNNLKIEFYLTNAASPGMTGCGLWIINPPFTLAEELKSALQALRKICNPGISSYLIE